MLTHPVPINAGGLPAGCMLAIQLSRAKDLAPTFIDLGFGEGVPRLASIGPLITTIVDLGRPRRAGLFGPPSVVARDQVSQVLIRWRLGPCLCEARIA